MKKIWLVISAVGLLLIIGGAMFFALNHNSSTFQTPKISSNPKIAKSISKASSKAASEASISATPVEAASDATSVSNNTSSGISPDINKTIDGNDITQLMIDQTVAELKAAGLPADQWAPSDIKALIVKASATGKSIVDVAKENFHQ